MMSEPKFINNKDGNPVLKWEEEGVTYTAQPKRMSECFYCKEVYPYMGANKFICLTCNKETLYLVKERNNNE